MLYWLVPSGKTMTQSVTKTNNETTEEKLQRVRTALNADADPQQHPQYQAIKQLFDRMVIDFAAGRDDLGDNIDYALHYREMVASGKMKAVPFTSREFFINSLRGKAVDILDFDKYRIAHIDELPGGKEALVYAYVSSEKSGTAEYCLWCVNDLGRWKAYDWEQLDRGIRGSYELAVVNADSSKFLYNDYIGAHDLLTEAAEADQWEDRDEIKRKIRLAESKRKIGYLQDQLWLSIAYAWGNLGEWKEALRCLDQISDSNKVPGVEMQRGWCYYGLDRHEEAIAHADKYEALIGRSPDVFDLRSICYDHLEQRDLAAQNYRGLLATTSDNRNALFGLARTVGGEQIEELKKQITLMSQPLTIAQELAQRFTYARFFAGVDAMLALAKQDAPESAAAVFIEGLQAEVNGDYKQAVKLYQQAIQKAADPDDVETYTYQLIDLCSNLDQPLWAYNLLDEKQETFDWLVGNYEEGEYGISFAELQKLLAAHQQTAPNDPTVLRFAAEALIGQKKYGEAIELLENARQQMEDEQAQQLNYVLITAYAKAGREREALQKIELAKDTFDALAATLSQQEEFERLQQLVDLYRNSQTNDNSLARWESELLEHQGKPLEAIQKLQKVLKSEPEDSWTKNLHQQKILELATQLPTAKAVIAKDSLVDQELVLRAIVALVNKEEFEAARKLVELAQFYAGQNFRLRPLAEARILIGEKNFAQAAAIMTDQWMLRIDSAESDSKLVAARLLVRAARESGDLSRAEKYAQMIAEESGDTSELTRVACLQKNPVRLAELLQENGVWVLSYSGNLQNAFLDPVFDSVRRQYPPSFPNNPFDYSDKLFFNSAQDSDPSELKKRINAAFGGKVAIKDEVVSSDSLAEYLYSFTIDTLLFKISVGSKKLPFASSNDSTDDAKSLLEGCRSWIFVDSISINVVAFDEGPVEEAIVRKKLLSALDSNAVLGVEYDGRFLPIEQARKTLLKLKSDGTWENDRKLLEDAEYVWLDSELLNLPKLNRAQMEGLMNAAHELHGGKSQKKLRIKTSVGGDGYKQDAWLTVYETIPADYGAYDFHATLDTDIDVLNHQGLKAGAPFAVYTGNIVDWRIE